LIDVNALGPLALSLRPWEEFITLISSVRHGMIPVI